MSQLNSLNSVTQIFVVTVYWFDPDSSCMRDQDATTAHGETGLSRDKAMNARHGI